MKTIIHIGQHKTGTTSIQKYLYDHRLYLMQLGVYVPHYFFKKMGANHFHLNVYSLNSNRSSPAKDAMMRVNSNEKYGKIVSSTKTEVQKIYSAAKNAGCEKVIWSNEGLFLLNTVEEYIRLVDLFRDYSDVIEVVCCFRDKSEFMESYKMQLDKQGIEFSSVEDSYRYVESDSWLLNYEEKEKLLRKVFDSCLIFSYDQHDNVAKFFEVLGLEVKSTVIYKKNMSNKITGNISKCIKYLKRYLVGGVGGS